MLFQAPVQSNSSCLGLYSSWDKPRIVSKGRTFYNPRHSFFLIITSNPTCVVWHPALMTARTSHKPVPPSAQTSLQRLFCCATPCLRSKAFTDWLNHQSSFFYLKPQSYFYPLTVSSINYRSQHFIRDGNKFFSLTYKVIFFLSANKFLLPQGQKPYIWLTDLLAEIAFIEL